MARLQLLHLPSNSDGERIESRFGLVADHAGDLTDEDRGALRAFAAELGAQGVLVVSGILDLDQGDEDEGAVDAVSEMLQDLVSVPAIAQPTGQAPQLPPVSTTEGRLARVFGGQKIIDEMRGTDPR